MPTINLVFKIKCSQANKEFAIKQPHCSDCLIDIYLVISKLIGSRLIYSTAIECQL